MKNKIFSKNVCIAIALVIVAIIGIAVGITIGHVYPSAFAVMVTAGGKCCYNIFMNIFPKVVSKIVVALWKNLKRKKANHSD